MSLGKKLYLALGLFLAFYPFMSIPAVNADDDFDQNFQYLPQPLAPDVSSPMGAATLTIPIEVPKGRAGIEPRILLTYNSYKSNGWVSVGWDINMGYIQRSTKYGVSYSCDPGNWNSSSCGKNYGGSDFFESIEQSSYELVLRGNPSSHTYAKKIDKDFSRYYFNPGSGGWEVTDKQGTTRYYGTTGASRITDNSGTATFKWFLDTVRDLNGNYMALSYLADTNTAGAQLYLQEIDYTGVSTGPPPASQVILAPVNQVIFNSTKRSDINFQDTCTSYASGFR